MPEPSCHADQRPTREELVALILEECLANPGWSLEQLRSHLKDKGYPLGARLLRDMLEQHGLWKKQQRWLELEQRWCRGTSLDGRQTEFVAACNPWFKHLGEEGTMPGELLHQGVFQIGMSPSWERLYMHVLLDTYSAYAFASLATSSQAAAALPLILDEVLPFFEVFGLGVGAIVTRHTKTSPGTAGHVYRRRIQKQRIVHKTWAKYERSGYLADFMKTVRREFFQPALGLNGQNDLAEVEQNLKEWLKNYNTQHPLQGFPHEGRPPMALLAPYAGRGGAPARFQRVKKTAHGQ